MIDDMSPSGGGSFLARRETVRKARELDSRVHGLKVHSSPGLFVFLPTFLPFARQVERMRNISVFLRVKIPEILRLRSA